jgi:uncharacterized short protein YbdD (DUF466 family)
LESTWSNPSIAQSQEDLKSLFQKLHTDQAYAKELQIENPADVVAFYQNFLQNCLARRYIRLSKRVS